MFAAIWVEVSSSLSIGKGRNLRSRVSFDPSCTVQPDLPLPTLGTQATLVLDPSERGAMETEQVDTFGPNHKRTDRVQGIPVSIEVSVV
jgi:hypothetical protein